jgi:hypothetical protein
MYCTYVLYISVCTIHIYQCIYEIWLCNNFALHYITTNFILKHCIKGFLTQRWMAITTHNNLSNVHFDYHLNFPKRRCMTFQERCKTISGEMHIFPGQHSTWHRLAQ